MSLSVACPSCGSKLRAPDNVAGRLIKCPKCGNPFRVRNDAAQLKRPTPPSCKPAPVPDVLTVDVTRLKQTRRLSPIVLVAWGIVGLFILAFGVTVGLVLNFTVKPTELAENKEVASGSRTESHEPSRLLDERDVDNQAPVEPPRRSPAPDPEALAAEKHRREEKAKADSERKAKEKAETEPRKAEEKAETERKAARKKTEEKSEVEKAKITSLDDIVAKFSGAEKTYVEAYIRNRFRRPRIPEWDIGSNRLLQRSISSLQTGEIGILGFISGKVVRVRQVVNDREVLAAGQGADGREQGDFWIEGVDTKDIADGDLVGVEKLVLVVAGAKRYRTVLGATRSVKHFVVLDIEKLEAAVVRMYTEAKREEEKRQRQERERQKKEEVQRRAAAEETRRQEAARAEEARRQQEARAAEAKRQEEARIKASVAQNRAALNGPDRKTRIQAAIELGKLGPRAADAVPELSKALVDENEQFSKAAADALAKIGKPATPALIDTLANGTPRSRRNAASALVSMNDDAKESVPAPDATVRKLKAMFRDTDEAVLLAAVLDALAIVGGLEQSMVDQLLTNKGLQHSDAAVRSKALDCLRRVAVDKVRIETLAKLNLEDPSPDVRNHAYKALSARIDHCPKRT